MLLAFSMQQASSQESFPNLQSPSLITLDQSLLDEQSSTSRIDQMTRKQLEHVENFTLEHVVAGNKVTFLTPLDLSSQDTIEQLNYKDNFILHSTGSVTIDTNHLPILSTPATITMSKLPYTKTPLIYKDGNLVTKEDVTNFTYIYSLSAGGTLTFEVTSFSTYEARESSQDQIPTPPTPQLSNNSSIPQLLVIICLAILWGVVIVVVARRVISNFSRN